ncbi:UNVERIFIED_CONTAM: hypothetical protein HDU68_004011 [Siphonaria sp. JEL0065]|nr:hypothetical protein HDU68_004011 [Siphonaria sp. JEL0065]
MLIPTTLLALAAAVFALPQVNPLPSAVSGESCNNFGEWACSNGALVQCAYANSYELVWYQNGNTLCAILDNSLDAPQPADDVPQLVDVAFQVEEAPIEQVAPAPEAGSVDPFNPFTNTPQQPPEPLPWGL